MMSAVVAYDSAHEAAALAHSAPRAHHEHNVDGVPTRQGSLLELSNGRSQPTHHHASRRVA